MAITLVGAEVAVASGDYPTVNSISVPYPTGLTAGDTMHLFVVLPLYRWYATTYGTTLVLVRQYGIGIPAGWQLVATDSYSPHLSGNEGVALWRKSSFLLRRVAVGTESGDVVIPITRTDYRPDLTSRFEALHVGASLIAHSGVNLYDPYDQPPVFRAPHFGGWPTGNALSPDSRLVELAAAHAYGEIAELEQMHPWPNPAPIHPSYGDRPAGWDVAAQESNLAGPSKPAFVMRAAALDTGDFTPGRFYPAFSPVRPEPGVVTSSSRVLFALRDGGGSLPVDPPPAPGQLGVTGSGSVTPEWVGRDRVIQNPLVCSVWTEGQDGEGQPELQLLASGDETLQPVAADVTFNGLGACTSAQLAFPEHPGLIPYAHAVKLALATTGGAGTPDWWAGVVKNMRYDNGLYIVTLDGLWSLLNEARVQLDDEGGIATPSHPVITEALTVGLGDPTTLIVEDARAAQQTWGTHLNNRFRVTPQAAWGIGPDQVFIMGQPEQAGIEQLDADAHPAVTAVTPAEFILPPFVTEWWAQDSAGDVHAGEVFPPAGLLTPSRLKESHVDELGHLVTPKEADYPLISGPSHEITVAGIAIPPLQVVNLPNGEAQVVASSRVQITLGEEGSAPRVTTTLTTVALPYERGRS